MVQLKLKNSQECILYKTVKDSQLGAKNATSYTLSSDVIIQIKYAHILNWGTPDLDRNTFYSVLANKNNLTRPE